MKRKKLEALKEYRNEFYNVKFQLAGTYISYVQKQINEKQMVEEIYNLWEYMYKLNEKLG